MYKVKVDGNTIYNPASSDLVIIDPKLTLEVNNAGEFDFVMPPTHPFYGSVERLSSVVTVEEDGSTIFEGRVTEEKTDFWKRKSYHCEGCLAYLKDTKQPPAEYHNLTVRQYLGILLNIHNSKVTADKQFELGAVTVTDSNDSLYRYTNWESTLQCINDDLLKSLGGYLRIRYEGGKRYLDYLAAFPNTNSQIIRFGRNLLDYASSYDSSDYCTVLIPQGAELEESPIPALHQRLSIEDVNGGSPYLVNADAVAEHGWIEKVIEWDGVHVATTLLRKGKKYLEDVQFDSMVLSIKAIDLHKLNPEIESIKLMDEIRAISKPHGMDRIFPVTKVSIPLDSASGTEYTLGTKVTHSLTSTTEAANEDILNRIKRAKTPQQILESAQDNASELIKSALNGYVVITDDASELLVMDTPDINTARKVWRWNVNGLGYSNNGYDGKYGLALTMDGAIVADFITTGTLNANLLRAGKIEDAQGYNYWDLQTGDFHLLALQDYAKKANTIVDTTPQYAVSTSSKDAPKTGWGSDAPSWEEGKYVWFRLLMVNGNNEPVYSEAVCIQGAKGEAGTSVTILGSYATLAELQADHPTGNLGDSYMVGDDLYVWNGTEWQDVGQIRGDDGRDATQYYTYFAYATSADGSQGFSTQPFEGAVYMGVCTSTATKQPQTYGYYTWSKAKGENGVSVSSQVPQYYLSDSSVTQSGGMWTEDEPTWKSGYYIWSRLKIQWSSGVTTYTSPILARALNSANETADSAKSTAQSAEATAEGAQDAVTALDQSLYTEEIFNRLTNNGAVQGITMSNGNLYVNASYINSGILNADLIKSGTINANLIKSGTINANLIKSGTINADLIKAGTINADLIKSGTINADLIKAGTISDAKGNNYWNLNTGEFSLSAYATNSRVDAVEATAQDAAVEAETAKSVADALDKSLDSAEVFKRLTDNGKVKGITMSDGNLYINASYINSGVLNADLMTAGIITDKKKINYWDLDTGEFKLSALSSYATKTEVQTAQETAETAQSTADTAKTTATTAKTTADSAKTTATSAKSTADAAKATADDAVAAVDELDEALKTEEIFNRLTDNGKIKGITMSEGNLYINASYINSGALNAGLMTAGIITDKNGVNYWNLDTGEFSLSALSSYATKSEVQTAQETAEAAQTTAEAAQTTANSASTTATTAKTTADSAKTTATTAKTTADSAKTTATTAKNTADSAKTTATTAKNTADSAVAAVEELDESLKTEEIFNRLTDNGKIKGITMSNGNLYVNATYIKSGYLSANRIHGGTLKLGGSNNTYGNISIYDASGTLKGTIDSGGISAQLGQFNAINIDNIDGDNSASITLNSERLDIEAGTLPVWVHNLHTNQLDVTTLGATNAYITYDNVTNLYANYVELTGDFVWWTSTAKANYVFAREARSSSPTGYTLLIPDAQIARLSFQPWNPANASTYYRPVASYGTNGNRVNYISAHSSSHSVPNSLGVNAQFGSTSAYSTKNFAPSSSDIRLKENVKDCEIEALPFIQKIRMRQFDWKENGVHQDCGFVADELEQLDRNLSIGGGYEEDGTMNEKSVNDFYLLGYMVKAMQEMQAEIDYLKGVVKDGINRRVD